MNRFRKDKNSIALPIANRKRAGRPSSARPVDPVRMIDAETAKLTATEYCLFHYPTLYTAGTPCLLSDQKCVLWMIPILLVTPSRGVLGQVGELQVDGWSGKVVASTNRSQVLTKGKQLVKEK